jgi:DNA-directed RNA polymerase subunit RPC12/RpoP
MCTHTVRADVEQIAKKMQVVPGQKCPRCSGRLDVAVVVQVLEAA